MRIEVGLRLGLCAIDLGVRRRRVERCGELRVILVVFLPGGRVDGAGRRTSRNALWRISPAARHLSPAPTSSARRLLKHRADAVGGIIGTDFATFRHVGDGRSSHRPADPCSAFQVLPSADVSVTLLTRLAAMSARSRFSQSLTFLATVRLPRRASSAHRRRLRTNVPPPAAPLKLPTISFVGCARPAMSMRTPAADASFTSSTPSSA